MLRYVYIHSNEQEVAVAGAERGVVEDLVEDSELLAMGLEKGSMGARARPSLPAASMVTKAAGCSDEMIGRTRCCDLENIYSRDSRSLIDLCTIPSEL